MTQQEIKIVAEEFATIFAGRKDARGTLQGGCIRESVEDSHFIDHLTGKVSLGCYLLHNDGTCKAALVDFDFKSDPNRVELAEREARRFGKKLFELGLESYSFERSRSGMIHLWLFFSEPIKARKIRRILQFLAKKLSLKIANGIVEIFPKQNELSDGQIGNYIHLPYFCALNGSLPDRRVMLDRDTFEPIPLETFLDRVNQSLISPHDLDLVYDSLPKEDSETEEKMTVDVESDTYSESVWQVTRKQIIEIMRSYWVKGSRQDLSLYLSDLLGRKGISRADTEILILEICLLCKDNETPQRFGAVKSTYEKQGAGEKTNYKGMKEILSAADFERLVGLFSRANKADELKVPWPEPLAARAFYGLAGEIIHAIEQHTEADPSALLIEFLTAFGSVIGLKPYFRVEADEHRMRLFIVLVGESSKARKGSSWGHIQRLFQTIDADWVRKITSGLSSGEGLIWAVRNEIIKREPIREHKRVIDYQDVIADPGVTDKRLLVFEAEFASTLRVLGREGNTLSAVIRNAWDTGNLQTLTKNSQAKATGAHIALIAHITRHELLRYLTNTEAGNGFGNRFLWICVKRSKSLPFGGEIHKINFEPLIKLLSAAVKFASQVECIQWAEETRRLWAQIYPALSEGKPGLFGAMTARAEAYVTRLACIYALLDLSRLDLDKTESDKLKVEIEPEHLLAAVAVWDYAEDSARYIFQTAMGDTLTGDELADDILSVLMTNPEGMTRTGIYNYFSHHKSSEQITTALDTFEALGKVRKEIIPTEGRSAEVWFFNQPGAQEAQKAQEG